MRTHYPVIVLGHDGEGYCAKVAGTPVLGEGETVSDALVDASKTLQEVIDDAARDGEPVPMPGQAEPIAGERCVFAIIQAEVPVVTAA